MRYKGQGPYADLYPAPHRRAGHGDLRHRAHSGIVSRAGISAGYLNDIYKNWAFQIFIFFCALFHAINGLRITLLDLFPKLIEHQREAIWMEWAVFIPVFGIAVFVILSTALGG
ncbi:MAG: hypothetical protein MZV64_58715 [Ignavibacteriales bacterium]|nr:hypothetical protein [Ignavibacteriales bacterium]